MADGVIACGPTVCFTLKSNAAESKACEEEEGNIKDGRVEDIDSLSMFMTLKLIHCRSLALRVLCWLSRVSEIILAC